MRKWSFKARLIGVLLTVLTAIFSLSSPILAEEFGGTEPGGWVLGFRVGFAPLTQQLSENTSTSIGPLVNFQGLYSLNSWFLVGMMLEWERH
ncbi:MAG: hypothetical protein ACXWWI_08410, partial [Nitrospira sp.]